MPSPTNVTVCLRTPNKVAERLEIAARVIMLAYTALMAWQVAKAICPPLAVHEQVLIARVRQRLPQKPRPVAKREADEFVAEVTRFVREHEER